MRFPTFKVGTRLGVGFALLLIASVVVGVIGVSRLGDLNDGVEQLATKDWAKAVCPWRSTPRARDSCRPRRR